MTKEDFISRQQAFDAIKEYFTRIGKLKRRGLTKGEKAISLDMVGTIKTLPSAQIEPESISKWKKEFREYVDSLDITRDDWKGIIEYIDELPSAEPDTTTHDSIPAETGKNDGDGTSGDCISRQANCEYCHEDSDGYVLSVEKNGHAYIQNGKLALRANGWWGECGIDYCPMCGRRLTYG